jgi:uncharacterized protein YoxC
MRNKIIAGIIVALALSIIKMGLEYVLKAEECKADLEAFKTIEIQNKNLIKTSKENVKIIEKKIIANPDIKYRMELLDQIEASE